MSLSSAVQVLADLPVSGVDAGGEFLLIGDAAE